MRIQPDNLNFDLPEDLIAQEALKEREKARLMILNRSGGKIDHCIFSDITNHLNKGDVLVINQARVNHAKLIGQKETGGKVEVILVEPMDNPKQWKALVRPLMKPGTRFQLANQAKVVLKDRTDIGENILFFEEGDGESLIKTVGQIPLPPYIKRQANDQRNQEDEKDYQTVYASKPGSLAAPTAGLHFSVSLLETIKNKGVHVVPVVLHVGWGTFRPIASSLKEHEMLAEKFEISEEAVKELKKAKKENRRIVAVGTTCTRVVESLPLDVEEKDQSSQTNLFITPGFQFKWLSGLVTNFHVPRSTPISLTAAFVGMENLEKAYGIAIEKKYRFFSYGDAMMIL